MQRELNKLHKAHEKYEKAYNEVDEIVKNVCDFEAGLTHCAGDGHLILNLNNSNVASLGLIHGHSEENKLTEEEFNKYTK